MAAGPSSGPDPLPTGPSAFDGDFGSDNCDGPVGGGRREVDAISGGMNPYSPSSSTLIWAIGKTSHVAVNGSSRVTTTSVEVPAGNSSE